MAPYADKSVLKRSGAKMFYRPLAGRVHFMDRNPSNKLLGYYLWVPDGTF
jgi:hypothetical protein